MPGRDKTGPRGLGAGTGRRQGICTTEEYGVIGDLEYGRGIEFKRGLGIGRGARRGIGIKVQYGRGLGTGYRSNYGRRISY